MMDIWLNYLTFVGIKRALHGTFFMVHPRYSD